MQKNKKTATKNKQDRTNIKMGLIIHRIEWD